MAKKELTIALKAVDEASGVFRKVEQAAKGMVQRSALTRPFDVAPIRQVQRTRDEQMIRDEKAIAIRRLRAGAVEARREQARIIAEEQLFGKRVAQVQGEARLQETRKQNGRLAAEQRGFIKQLQGQFGRGSTFKESLEILTGGGAIIGVSMLMRMLANSAAKAKDLSMELRAGSKGAGDVVDELAATLPILGSAYRITKDIQEIFTGEEATLQRIREHTEAINKATAGRAEAEKRVAELQASFADVRRQAQRGAAIRNDPSGQTELWFNREDALEGVAEKAKDASDAVKNEFGESRKAVEKDLERLNAAYKSAADFAKIWSTQSSLDDMDRIAADRKAALTKLQNIDRLEAQKIAEIEASKTATIETIQSGFADQSIHQQKEYNEKQAEEARKQSQELIQLESETARARAAQQQEHEDAVRDQQQRILDLESEAREERFHQMGMEHEARRERLSRMHREELEAYKKQALDIAATFSLADPIGSSIRLAERFALLQREFAVNRQTDLGRTSAERSTSKTTAPTEESRFLTGVTAMNERFQNESLRLQKIAVDKLTGILGIVSKPPTSGTSARPVF